MARRLEAWISANLRQCAEQCACDLRWHAEVDSDAEVHEGEEKRSEQAERGCERVPAPSRTRACIAVGRGSGCAHGHGQYEDPCMCDRGAAGWSAYANWADVALRTSESTIGITIEHDASAKKPTDITKPRDSPVANLWERVHKKEKAGGVGGLCLPGGSTSG